MKPSFSTLDSRGGDKVKAGSPTFEEILDNARSAVDVLYREKYAVKTLKPSRKVRHVTRRIAG